MEFRARTFPLAQLFYERLEKTANATQTPEQILANDYTLASTGDAIIGKDQYLAGIPNQRFRTTSLHLDSKISHNDK